MRNWCYILILLCLPQILWAADTWIGPTTITQAAWDDPSNWLSGNLPGSAEKIILSGNTYTISESLTTTQTNLLDITGDATLIIGSNVNITFNQTDINGPNGQLIVDGTLNLGNLVYNAISPPTAGSVITNNGTMSVTNLNVGNANDKAGDFINNGTLTVTKNIVVEEGNLINSSTGVITSEGIIVKPGGNIENSGTMSSIGDGLAAKISVNSGGTFTNKCGGTLNSQINLGNVVAIDINGTFTNEGEINVGIPSPAPYNPGSQGIFVRANAVFANVGECAMYTFNIDPNNCVIQDNATGTQGGSFLFESVDITTTIDNISGKVQDCFEVTTIVTTPIKLVKFEASIKNNQVSLTWQTSSEIAVSHYEIESSTDGVNFNKIAQVSANNTASNYQKTVLQNQTKTYYRLKSIDTDGTFQYSKVLEVIYQKNDNNFSVAIYPTLVPQNTTIQYQVHSENIRGQANIEIINTNGQLVHNLIIDIATVDASYSDVLSGFPKGLYFVRLVGERQVSDVSKFVIN